MSEENNVEVRQVSIGDLNPSLRDAMQELATPVIPQIEEREFVDKWLRLFANLTNEERETIGEEATRRPVFLWVQEVSKNGQMPVDVYRGSEFLYRVPPVLADVKFNFREQFPDYDISGEVALAQKKSQIVPQLGEEHFRERVEQIVLPKFVPSIEHGVAWNKIFERYGMPLMDLVGETKAEEKKALPSQGDGGLNLDEIDDL